MVDLVIVGAGAAGLMAAIWAARSGSPPLVLEGARKLGVKILVSGGGRCNLTHDVVTQDDYAGSKPHAIGKVLRRLNVEKTVEFFAEIGVELKREETGKLFPTTDSAKTVLNALLNEARDEAVERLKQQASKKGANAIINVRLATSSVAQGAAELFAYGTAVKVEPS